MATPIHYEQEQGQLQLALVSDNITEHDVTAHSTRDSHPKYLYSMISIKYCSRNDPAYLFCLRAERQRPRKYIKVHSPKTCKCLARGRIEPIIRKPDGDTTTPASENIFRMLYFRRADGVYRNALGQAVKDDDGHDFGRKPIVLKDLVRVVGPKLGSILHWKLDRMLREMMEYPAEFYGS
ncbi:hypothetical protein LTR70_006745 [Exophiala xenobiotica]|uniref:Uncharacterized protein n=1 Tax=Lithohypha guttulata TaxID=1690604 RepID=A0ABR0KAA1_9EURO|nr:hypothetical protein LTR24_005011 [Lithohypha guttulata]KAK5315406.1 hypothetical protein LTR70_006745 [Exophiala xenobiotica]